VGGLMSSMPRCTVVSFGYGHGPAPESDVIIDLRELLHRPLPTALRTMDGHDTCIKHWVENTPGAWAVINGVVDMVRGILAEAPQRNVQVAAGGPGGLHRSVVVAANIGRDVRQSGCLGAVQHRHMDRALEADSATCCVWTRPLVHLVWWLWRPPPSPVASRVLAGAGAATRPTPHTERNTRAHAPPAEEEVAEGGPPAASPSPGGPRPHRHAN